MKLRVFLVLVDKQLQKKWIEKLRLNAELNQSEFYTQFFQLVELRSIKGT
jgi:hypothetical protein